MKNLVVQRVPVPEFGVFSELFAMIRDYEHSYAGAEIPPYATKQPPKVLIEEAKFSVIAPKVDLSLPTLACLPPSTKVWGMRIKKMHRQKEWLSILPFQKWIIAKVQFDRIDKRIRTHIREALLSQLEELLKSLRKARLDSDRRDVRNERFCSVPVVQQQLSNRTTTIRKLVTSIDCTMLFW